MSDFSFFSRDISWLSFNGRVLSEAAKENVPLMERLRFLSIYSSNLDEWYRVRMPVLLAKQDTKIKQVIEAKPVVQDDRTEVERAKEMINEQQERFGFILTQQLIPLLQQQEVYWLYNHTLPDRILPSVHQYFYASVAAYLHIVHFEMNTVFFPENNKLYLVVSVQNDQDERLMIINIPSDELPRFYTGTENGKQYILFIDDIVRQYLPVLFPGSIINECYSFKLTRNAELDLEEEVTEKIAEQIEKRLAKRDQGNATRLLYQQNMPLRILQCLCASFKISLADAVPGGHYHNLKDISSLPINNNHFSYPKQLPLEIEAFETKGILFDEIQKKDILIHPPYQSYDAVLRFFNEAAIDEEVTEIYVTLYRIATDSKIANALISAAANGKKVQVFVELKARFDEANNIRWAKKMKAGGVQVIYSIPRLKVHAKLALVKKKDGKRQRYIGLLATGNMNESTARFYTDHVLLTANKDMLQEMEMLFIFLSRRTKPGKEDNLQFRTLLVAQFNLQQQFIKLIDNEIKAAKEGLPSGIIIKVNNLEERVLISKLYEASNAGVTVQMIVRSVCCLIPGEAGMSENITIRRIVGRYLEHGRVFVFHNLGEPKVFMGSADWMNRNIYTRIEVCFPLYDNDLKKEILAMIQLQLADNEAAVWLNKEMHNIPVQRQPDEAVINSQHSIYQMLSDKPITHAIL